MPAPNVATFLHRANSPIEIPEQATIVPAPGRILIRLARETEGKYGTIILPPSPTERRFYGRVEAVTTYALEDGLDLDEPWLKVGDLVFFGKFVGTELQINREAYIICKETDILGIVRNANEILVLEEEVTDVQR